MNMVRSKLKKKKGFTLVELLIVVAIIAILAAIAIPAYAAQMEKARISTDTANARSASSMSAADYLLQGFQGAVDYTFKKSSDGNIVITSVAKAGTGGSASDDAKITAANTSYGNANAGLTLSDMTAESSKVGTAALTVTIGANGVITANSWSALLNA